MGKRVGAVAMAMAALACTPAHAAQCSGQDKVDVPGAEMQRLACLDDMTTTATEGTDYTDASDWGTLSPASQRKPSGVPGLQVDGYFPDTSTANTTHGWLHDSQFVLRMPTDWNGKLVVTGAPGVRKQYAQDAIISDWVLSRGYAYASTDKGNGGAAFYTDGEEPGDAGVEWNMRVTELAIAAKQVIAQYYGREADRTYVTGISQGGYLTRWQLENRPDLYDGGVDWEGTFWNASAPNVFTNLPAAIRHYPAYSLTGSQEAHDAMIAAGFAPGSEFLWADHYTTYWDLTQRTYREEFDPGYDGPLPGGVPFCQPGMPVCDADYDYSQRPEARDALRRIENSGAIGRPMLTLHGTLDSLLPIATHADLYTQRLRAAGKGRLHRYYVIENGNHVDSRYDSFPDRIRPIYPCYTDALTALDAWVEKGKAPPPSQFLPDARPDGYDVVNECTLGRGPTVPGAGPMGSSGPPEGKRVEASRLTLAARRRGTAVVVRGRLVLGEDTLGCGSGRVAVRLAAPGRRPVRRFPALRADCAYRARIRVPAAARGRVSARFTGNRLAHGLAARTVRLG